MNWEIGKRVNLEALTVTRYSWYERETYNGQRESCHRYAFRSAYLSWDHFVYSGRNLGLHEGQTVCLRGTVKRIETRWRCVRLSRVKVVSVGEERKLV